MPRTFYRWTKGEVETLKWGVIGYGNVARRRFVPALARSRSSSLQAIGTSSREKVSGLAKEFARASVYGSYGEVLNDPLVEAVYISLPNSMHFDMIISALSAGKHVLCEKPLVTSTEEFCALSEHQAGTGRILEEGVMFRHHSQWDFVLDLIESGRMGRPSYIQAHFGYHEPDHGNIRNKQELGGGALWDMGGYPLHAARLIFGEDPVRVTATGQIDSTAGVDQITCAFVEYASGILNFTVGSRLSRQHLVQIFSDSGRIELRTPNIVSGISCATVWVDDGALRGGASAKGYDFPFEDVFAKQLDYFEDVVAGRCASSLPLSFSGQVISALEAVARASAMGHSIQLLPAALGLRG
jgi:predicted dehydrogenase